MIYIQVKDGRDPRVLADLIASAEHGSVVDPKLEVEAAMLREHQEQVVRERPSHDTMETVDFKKLDDDNEWTDL
jgi:hypothetical protein